MAKKTTFEEFVERATKLHNGKYKYSRYDFEHPNEKGKIRFVCPRHGEFWQTVKNHLKGWGCGKCGREDMNKPRKKNTEQFVKEVKEIWGDKLIFDKVDYQGAHKKVIVTCPEHGDFLIEPSGLLNGHGCAKCSHRDMGLRGRCKQEDVIRRIKEIHGDKYDLSRFVYVKNGTKSIVGCKKHGWFEITPNALLRGNGCRKCGFERMKEANSMRKEEYFRRCREIHNNRYTYDEDSYINTYHPIKAVCPIHGEFEQGAKEHIEGHGCPICAAQERGEQKRITFEEFKERSQKIHSDKYSYYKDTYTMSHAKTKISCPIHGDFWQSADKHLSGQGCPKCSVHISKAETEIFNHIKGILGEDKVMNRDKTTIKPYELDIHIPSMKIAIEYDGLIWHSDKYSRNTTDKENMKQLKKTLLCEEKGIRLIHVFEDEYLNNKELVLEKIDHILGIDQDKPKIMARKCKVNEIPSERAEVFLNKYHIQGFSRSTVYLGCYHNDELVGVMSFKQESKNGDKWELTRFASNNNYICSGVAGKLFKYFTRHYDFSVIKSFADRRWSIDKPNNLYRSLGFELDAYTKPDYKYVVNGKERVHKFNFRKDRIAKKYGLDRNLTERELTEQIGVHRIYDCGLIRYIYRKEK